MSDIDEGSPAATPQSSPAAIPAPAPAVPADWQTLPSQAATVAMFGGAGWGLLLAAGPFFFAGLPLLSTGKLADLPWWQALLLVGVAWLAVGGLGAFFSYRRWLATTWKLDDTGLHLRRGRMWRKEVLVPRTRVQHLDIERGPIERRYGLASLVVHTAGTRQHAMRITGLHDADAVALRDALVPDASRHDDVL